MKTGIELIEEERKRQIEAEGYTPEHDEQYTTELFDAACCYYAAKRMRALNPNNKKLPSSWPWSAKFWKPSHDNRVRELEKAGALFMAHNELKEKDIIIDDCVLMCASEIDEINSKSN